MISLSHREGAVTFISADNTLNAFSEASYQHPNLSILHSDGVEFSSYISDDQ